ncbi:MAG: hypothetical protein WC455_27710 [Dehalococcoidia bacterium]|jgi:hypothetical protein
MKKKKITPDVVDKARCSAIRDIVHAHAVGVLSEEQACRLMAMIYDNTKLGGVLVGMHIEHPEQYK